MALSDTAIRAAKPRPKPYKMGDAEGLFLLVQPSGGKLWRVKFRVAGREKKLAIGTYPKVSLKDARKLRDEAKSLLAAGGDPALAKQREKLQTGTDAANTFETVAREYFDKRKRDGSKAWAPATAAKNEYLLALIAPALGRVPIKDLTATDVLTAVRRLEAKGTLESARRALQLAGGVFRYGVATARLASDPTRDLRGALTSPTSRNHGAILDAERFGELLRAIEGYGGHYSARLALQLAPHVFVRPGELRQAMWEEVDLEAAVWTIPASKAKMRRPHHVPLSRQAVAIFEQARALTNRREGFVFPSIRTTDRPMSENTLGAALQRLGYTGDEMTAHGFRATASTLLNESGKWSSDAIERALAHGDPDKVRAAYNRGPHWGERVLMAQWWSDHLDALRKGAEIIRLPRRA